MKPTYEELEQQVLDMAVQLANAESKCRELAAENAGLKAAKEIIRHLNVNREEANFCGIDDCYIDDAVAAMITPSTDAFLAEVRASAIPEGYVLVPQEMHLSSEAMEGICFHCGDGDHQFGEFTDGTLFVGEVDYGDGKKVHGLHIATADYPEEGCATICEFAAQLRKGADL